MRAKRVGADTFECPLIFACQIIDMRVGLRLERAFRENSAGRWARRRRRGQCGLLRNAPKARCCKLSYPTALKSPGCTSSAAAIASTGMWALPYSAMRSIWRGVCFVFIR
jgi:hypothetical protein